MTKGLCHLRLTNFIQIEKEGWEGEEQQHAVMTSTSIVSVS